MPVCAIRPNSYASAGYLILQSIPLLFFPRILLLLSTPRGAVGQAGGEDADASATSRLGPTLTPIEQFTSFSWGLSMITLALTTIIQVRLTVSFASTESLQLTPVVHASAT